MANIFISYKWRVNETNNYGNGSNEQHAYKENKIAYTCFCANFPINMQMHLILFAVIYPLS